MLDNTNCKVCGAWLRRNWIFCPFCSTPRCHMPTNASNETQKPCPDCGGTGLSRFDCICHGGGNATRECSPCETCNGTGIDPCMKPREIPGWTHVLTFGSTLDIYKHDNRRIVVDRKTGEQLLEYNQQNNLCL